MMKHIQRFKKITNFCIKNNYITKDPFVGFKISFKKTNRVYINKDELYILKNKNSLDNSQMKTVFDTSQMITVFDNSQLITVMVHV